MGSDPDAEIIYRLPNGKLIFKEKSHPAHKSLTAGELQNVAFHFHEQMVVTDRQLQKYAKDTPEYNRTKVQYQSCKECYFFFNKLWRKSLIAAKKTR